MAAMIGHRNANSKGLYAIDPKYRTATTILKDASSLDVANHSSRFLLTHRGFGQTTCIGIGGDPIPGMNFIDCLQLFEEDPETKAVVIIGEIGGPQEVEAAQWAKDNMSKPVVGYIAQ